MQRFYAVFLLCSEDGPSLGANQLSKEDVEREVVRLLIFIVQTDEKQNLKSVGFLERCSRAL